jgi:hypothetical protein
MHWGGSSQNFIFLRDRCSSSSSTAAATAAAAAVASSAACITEMFCTRQGVHTETETSVDT